jgi:hypothetical protein
MSAYVELTDISMQRDVSKSVIILKSHHLKVTILDI